MDITLEQIKQTLTTVLNTILEIKDVLTEIDSRSGDGDMGLSMEKFSAAVLHEVESYSAAPIGMMFMKAAMAANKAAPSTMGTLLSSSLMELGKFAGQKTAITEEDAAKIPALLAQSISARGKANLGDKTILDSLIPLAQKLEQSLQGGMTMPDAFREAANTALKAAYATAGMTAHAGRAKWLAERSKDCPDGGAVMCGLVAVRLANGSLPEKSEILAACGI